MTLAKIPCAIGSFLVGLIAIGSLSTTQKCARGAPVPFELKKACGACQCALIYGYGKLTAEGEGYGWVGFIRRSGMETYAVKTAVPSNGVDVVQGNYYWCTSSDPAEVPFLPREDYLEQRYEQGVVRCVGGQANREIVASNFESPTGLPTGDAFDFPHEQHYCPPAAVAPIVD